MKKFLIIAAVALLLPLNPSTSATALVPHDNPEVAAKNLYSAWKRRDRPAARRVASRSAVNQLFKSRFTNGAPEWQFQGCEKRRGGYDCFYSFEGGGTTMRVTGSSSAGYRITSIKSIAD